MPKLRSHYYAIGSGGGDGCLPGNGRVRRQWPRSGWRAAPARDFHPRGITINVVQPCPIDTDINPKMAP